MDESGFSSGSTASTRVIIDTQTSGTRYSAHPEHQEWVSVLECIGADRDTIPPLMIFKGSSINTRNIVDEVPDGWKVSSSPKEWKWFQDCFKPATREQAAGEPQVLICDKHGSHMTGKFVDICLKNNIRLLVMPPHALDLLQPLDLACFGPLKTYLSRNLRSVVKSEALQIQRQEWFCAYAAARPLTLRKSNIASGFQRAGLFPLVLRRLPAEATKLEQCLSRVLFTSHRRESTQWLQQASPAGPHMRQANSVVRRMLASENPIERPARSYLKKVVDRMEQHQAELTLTTKELEEL